MPTAVVSKCVGLVTQYNSLTVVDGALTKADNGVIKRENIIENRRGYRSYGTTLDQPIQVMSYSGRILSHLDNETIVYDNGSGTFTAYSGTYTEPTGYRIHSVEANNNLYITTSVGVKVIQDIAGTAAREVGIAKCLNISLSLSDTDFDWLVTGNSVAYRACYKKTDENDNVIRGTPSAFEAITNSSGADRSVSVVVYLAGTITTSDVIELYRSPDVSTGSPTDEMTLCYQGSPSSADITNGYMTILDQAPYAVIENGLPLYTSESQGGIAQANDQPPLATDIALYKSNYMFYFNTVQKQTLNLTMVGVEPLGNIITATLSAGSPTVTLTAGTIGNLKVGDKVVSTHFTAGTTIVSISAPNITLSNNAGSSGSHSLKFYTSASLTIAGETYTFSDTETAASRVVGVDITSTSLATQIENTAKSLVKCINVGSASDLIYAYYVSGPNDLPGQIVLQERAIGGSTFTIQISNSFTDSAFFPVLPVSPATSTQSTSSASANTNYAYYSKFQELEAVPALNFLPIGPSNATILRGFALRDSVVVITNKGVYRISGETAPFSVAAIDLTVYGIAPESWATLANVAIGLSNQGVVAVSDTSVTVISREIEPNIIPLLGYDYETNVGLASGVSYESDRSYILSVPSTSTDTYPTQTYVYNAFTKAWTKWTHALCAGTILPANDKLYFCIPGANIVYQERKDFLSSDYYDPEYDITITNVTGRVITYTASITPVVGDVIYDASATLVIESIQSATSPFVVTVSTDVPSGVTGAAQIRPGIRFDVEYNMWTADSPAMLKRITMVNVLTDTIQQTSTASRIFVTFRTDVDGVSQERSITDDNSVWGDAPWGSFGWGGSGGTHEYSAYVPKGLVYCRGMILGVKHQVAGERMSLAAVTYEHDIVSERTTR